MTFQPFIATASQILYFLRCFEKQVSTRSCRVLLVGTNSFRTALKSSMSRGSFSRVYISFLARLNRRSVTPSLGFLLTKISLGHYSCLFQIYPRRCISCLSFLQKVSMRNRMFCILFPKVARPACWCR